MKVLLDEDLPHKLRLHIPNHDVRTVAYLGWDGLRNGELLRTAEKDGLEVLVTGDENLSYQQNLSGRKIGIVVLAQQDWRAVRENFEVSALRSVEHPLGHFSSLTLSCRDHHD